MSPMPSSTTNAQTQFAGYFDPSIMLSAGAAAETATNFAPTMTPSEDHATAQLVSNGAMPGYAIGGGGNGAATSNTGGANSTGSTGTSNGASASQPSASQTQVSGGAAQEYSPAANCVSTMTPSQDQTTTPLVSNGATPGYATGSGGNGGEANSNTGVMDSTASAATSNGPSAPPTVTTHTQVSGGSVDVYTDGAAKRTLKDNTLIETYPNQNNLTRTTIGGAGTVVETRDATSNPTGAVNADGTPAATGGPASITTVKTKDGTNISCTPGGAIFTDAKGMQDSVLVGDAPKKLGDGSTISVSPNGTTTITIPGQPNASAATTVTVDSNGTPVTKLVDGTSVYGNGETKIIENDMAINSDAQGKPLGKAKVTDSPTSTIEKWSNGQVVQTFKNPDGSSTGNISMTSQPDAGNSNLTLPDNTAISTSGSGQSGTFVIDLPNGVQISANEKAVGYTTKAGESTNFEEGVPKLLQDGTKVLLAGGELTVTRPDGTVIKANNSGLTTTLPDGRVFSGDGSLTITGADKSHTKYGNDGVVIDKSTIAPMPSVPRMTVETWDNSKQTHATIDDVTIDHDPQAGTTSSQLKQGRVDTTDNAFSTRVYLSDGSILSSENGAWQLSSNGHSIAIDPKADAAMFSGASIDLSDDGKTMTVKFGDGTVIDTNEFGVTTTTMPSGAQISANGTYTPKS